MWDKHGDPQARRSLFSSLTFICNKVINIIKCSLYTLWSWHRTLKTAQNETKLSSVTFFDFCCFLYVLTVTVSVNILYVAEFTFYIVVFPRKFYYTVAVLSLTHFLCYLCMFVLLQLFVPKICRAAGMRSRKLGLGRQKCEAKFWTQNVWVGNMGVSLGWNKIMMNLVVK